nr:hypothetical protein BaRGS_031052 [Batillaria attramentaria]
MRWYVVSVEGLGCFKCTSINHSNPECEDTFNNTDRFWEPDCWGTRKNRMGSFPGTQCIKMIAEDEGFAVVVRNCVVDDGGTNSETEIGRLTHCGWMRTIKYLGKRMSGCILACDTDGSCFQHYDASTTSLDVMKDHTSATLTVTKDPVRLAETALVVVGLLD